MATSNTTTLFSAVAACYDAAATFAERVTALRERALKDKVSFNGKDIKVYLMPATAAYYGVTLVDKQKGEGVTWDKDTKSQTAKKQNDRLAASVLGTTEKQSEEIEIPAELLAAAAKLAKLANEYEGARSLAAKALAAAFAK